MKNNFSVSVVAGLLLIFSATIAGADESILPYPDSGVDLAVGYDVQTGESKLNKCIKNWVKSTVNTPESDASFLQGNNSYSLSQHLDISAKLSISANEGVSKTKASGAVALEKSFSSNKSSRYIVAKNKISTRWDVVEGADNALITLTDDAAKLLASDKDAFAKQCGHGYVSKIKYGGAYYALFNMSDSQYTDTANFKVQLQASTASLGSGASGKVSVSSDLTNTVSSQHVDIQVSQKGGGTGDSATDLASVLTGYATFGKSVADNPDPFEMVITPYPDPNAGENSALLSEAEEPYVILSREYGKWSHLKNLLSSIIDDMRQASSSYVYLDTTLDDMNNMQAMADAKLAVIADVTKNCLAPTAGGAPLSHSQLVANCSLFSIDAKTGDRTPKQVDFTYRGKRSKVNVAESDIYYLARLPFSAAAFDAEIDGFNSAGKTITYADMVYNQIMGIYHERCGDDISVEHFCEDQNKINAAIAQYVPSADKEGLLFYKYKSGAGTGFCLSATQSGAPVTAACDGAASFALDYTKKQIRIHFPGQKDGDTQYCLYSSYDTKANTSTVSVSRCDGTAAQVDGAHDFVFWNVVETDATAPGDIPNLILKDATYYGKKNSEQCMDVSNRKTDVTGTVVVSYTCHAASDQSTNQKWRKIEPQFILL